MTRAAAFVARHRQALAALVEGDSRLPPRSPQLLQRGPVLARITSKTLISGAVRRWEYGWVEAWIVGSTGYIVDDKPGGLSGVFFSPSELGNSSVVINPGVDPADLPTGVDLRPLAGYVLLWPLRRSTGEVVWVSSHPGAVSGPCPEDK